MTERSSSHKSDGRQSSAGHSVHSTRLNSLGIETRPPAIVAPAPLGPPPGLFLLGPLPSIIRCWLDTKFSNDSLLYAAISTGSCKSILSAKLIQRLGMTHQVSGQDGDRKLKLQVYLAEATIQQSSTRSASPAPQVPTLTVTFDVQETVSEPDAIQIFIGSDLLRAKSADILFSQDRLTLLDDDRNKLAVPLVRPENSAVFSNLRIVNNVPTLESQPKPLAQTRHLATAPEFVPRSAEAIAADRFQNDTPQGTKDESSKIYSPIATSTKHPSVIGEGRRGFLPASDEAQTASPISVKPISSSHPESNLNGAPTSTPDTPTRPNQTTNSLWTSWRRDDSQQAPQRTDSTFSAVASGGNYARSGTTGSVRGKSMKVLKPSRSNTSRSMSAAQTPVFEGSAASRWPESNAGQKGTAGSGGETAGSNDESERGTSEPRRSFSSDLKGQGSKGRPGNNPIGGASAFGWLNSGGEGQAPK